MAKQSGIELEGKVVEPLPNAMFNVELENGKTILCTISGKIRMNYIQVQDHSSPWQGLRDLREPPPQAASGLREELEVGTY